MGRRGLHWKITRQLISRICAKGGIFFKRRLSDMREGPSRAFRAVKLRGHVSGQAIHTGDGHIFFLPFLSDQKSFFITARFANHEEGCWQGRPH